LSLFSLPRAAARSRRLLVCSAAAALVLLPGVAQAGTAAPTPAAESVAAPVTTDATVAATPAAATSEEPTTTGSTPSEAATTGSTPTETPAETTPAETTPTESTATESTSSESTPTEATPTETAPTGTVPTETTPDSTVTAGDADPTGTPVPTADPLEPAASFPQIDPAVLTRLFTPVCATGTLTTLTLQLDQLSALLDQLRAGGVPIPADVALPNGGTGTLDLPVDDTVLAEIAAQLNASSAEFAGLGVTDEDLAGLAGLPAAVQADLRALVGQLQAGTVQPATLRALLMDLFPCPAEPTTVVPEDVTYLGYAPTGGDGSTGGSPLALLGAGAALLAGGGVLTASALRSRAARA